MTSRTWLVSLQINFDAIRKVRGVDHKPAVVARCNRNPRIEFDCGGHHQALVVVRMLSHQVYSPRRTKKLPPRPLQQKGVVQTIPTFFEVYSALAPSDS